MANKNTVVSNILFSIYLILFVIFVCTIFFGGQMIGGSIYFIVFVLSVAFAFLDRKYHSSYINFYRYSAYLLDLFNILAVASVIYYGIHTPFMIASLCVLICGFLVDLFAKNRLEKRRVASILQSLVNCAFMFTMFLYFFLEEIDVCMAIIAVVFACILVALKFILALVPYKEERAQVAENTESKIILPQETANENDTDIDIG